MKTISNIFRRFIKSGIITMPFSRVLIARVEGGGNPEAGVVPEVMLHKKLLPEGFKPDLDELHTIGKVGMYHFDLSSTITAGLNPPHSITLIIRYLDICIRRGSNSPCRHRNRFSKRSCNHRGSCNLCSHPSPRTSRNDRSLWWILLPQQCHDLCLSRPQSN